MPYCKSCHREISKFDTDICPYCGEESPIDSNYKTMDITRRIDQMDPSFKLYKSKSQKVCAILSMTFGYFGVHNFYIKKNSLGYIDIAITVALVGILGSGLAFATPLPVWLGYVLSFLAAWAIFLLNGFIILKKDSPRDGSGEFLR